MPNAKKRKVLLIAGARPNFMKIAPIIEEMKRYPDVFDPVFVHTGQHYDDEMSKIFIEELGLPKPDVYLGVGSDSHAVQTAKIMIAFEEVMVKQKPDIVLVVGDVNSTVACALVASKHLVPVGHVEAGLRSYDRTMPEEINRLLTDQISDYLFTTCEDANGNLIKEGIREEKIHFVGNIMIESLLNAKQKINASRALSRMKLKPGGFVLTTLHRPSNVDDKKIFSGLFDALNRIQEEIPVVFPAHPRTQKQMEAFGFGTVNSRLIITNPIGYLDFLALEMHAKFVLTDSGGVQEETTIFGVPCLTIRENTERPITIEEGTNILVGTNPKRIVEEGLKILKGNIKEGNIPRFWDEKVSKRIVDVFLSETG